MGFFEFIEEKDWVKSKCMSSSQKPSELSSKEISLEQRLPSGDISEGFQLSDQ